jgi:hypothetical protein
MKGNDWEGLYVMQTKFFLTAFLFAIVLGLGACEGYEHKMPPNSPGGGIGSPTGPATGPAFQGVQG